MTAGPCSAFATPLTLVSGTLVRVAGTSEAPRHALEAGGIGFIPGNGGDPGMRMADL